MPSSKVPGIFWRKALALALLLLALAGGLELRLRRMDTLYHLKAARLAPLEGSLQVLVLGASQANQGLDPTQWPVQAANMACVAQDAYYDSELFKALLPQLPQLKALVLPISYVSLDSSLADTPETWRSFAYKQVFGLPNELPALRWDLRNWSALALTEPWPALKLACQGFKDPAAVVLNDRGFEAVAAMDEDEADMRINALTAAKRVRYHQSVMKPQNAAANLALYQGLIARARERGVKVLLVVFPVTRSYAQAVPAEALQRRKGLLAQLQGPGVELKDYFNDPRFKTMDFADVDHMNVNGARKFSRILWQEALQALTR
jgi:hypothetical protein